ncbi:uncharacterized protein VTP21DRAFT_5817 [Calcarisporiella thermophila]|uniref:uncharacterized protein n=1 Tax=Calcarisporiella thermophila TaxID=911321 RepID=UPI003742AB75
MGALCSCFKEDVPSLDEEVELSHFHLLRSVGKGAFGKVRVVQHKRSKELYALKYINKAKCIKMRAIDNIISERKLLESVDYPLIVNLRYAFQDDENLFMIIDLMLGGDLRFHLDRRGSLPEKTVRFYAAEISLALNYLHNKRIVHRDIKPDNILLDSKGHAHITDFNIAVHYSGKPLTAVAGSLAYMAPEVLLKRGYGTSVDWWSLGIVLYELLLGKRPYRAKSNDKLTQAILHEPLQFPQIVSDLLSPACLDALKQFCHRDISKRLGCGPDGMKRLQDHPWFSGIDWEALENKNVTPPFEPDNKRANFDAMHELEELMLEEKPLTVRKKKAQNILARPSTGDTTGPSADNTITGKKFVEEHAEELRILEERFQPYDFTRVGEVMRERKRSHAVTGNAALESAKTPDEMDGSRSLSSAHEVGGNGKGQTEVQSPLSPSNFYPACPNSTLNASQLAQNMPGMSGAMLVPTSMKLEDLRASNELAGRDLVKRFPIRRSTRENQVENPTSTSVGDMPLGDSGTVVGASGNDVEAEPRFVESAGCVEGGGEGSGKRWKLQGRAGREPDDFYANLPPPPIPASLCDLSQELKIPEARMPNCKGEAFNAKE